MNNLPWKDVCHIISYVSIFILTYYHFNYFILSLIYFVNNTVRLNIVVVVVKLGKLITLSFVLRQLQPL